MQTIYNSLHAALSMVYIMQSKTGDSPAFSAPKMATVNLQELEAFFLSLKDECCESVLEISMKCVRAMKLNQFSEAVRFNQVVSDYVWEKLHTGNWKEVPLVWRQMHSATKLVSAVAALREGRAAEALKEVDKGILMGAPILGGLLQKIASVLTDAITACGDPGSTISVSADDGEVVLAIPHTRKSTEEEEELRVGGNVGIPAQLTTQASVEEDRQRPHRRPIRFRNYQSVCEAADPEGGTSNGVLEQEPSVVDEASCTAALVKDRLYQKARQLRKGVHSGVDVTKMVAEPSNEAVHVVKNNTLPYVGALDHPCPPVEPVPVLECPSLEEFYCHCMQCGRPAVLKGCINHWPAFKGERKWSLKLLKQKYGPRTVPVELGSRYTDDSWSQRLMTLHEFITEYIECPSVMDSADSSIGYLAQHQLFDQIPELKEDILTPEYCYLGNRGADEVAQGMDSSEAVPAQVNAWFGPKGTVSPLHHDPEHNILVQVMGCKLVWLFPSDQTAFLYPHEGLLCNTSQVDVESPDPSRFPLFAQARGLQCTLQQGQSLYIPPGCWHYVRALDVSFSVSFWWH